MAFFEEIKNLLGLDEKTSDILITYMPSKGAVVSGYKKILKIEQEYISILCHNKRIIYVEGKNLQISSLASGEIVIQGKVDYVGEKHE